MFLVILNLSCSGLGVKNHSLRSLAFTTQAHFVVHSLTCIEIVIILCYIEKLESHINLLLLGLLKIIEAFVICSSLPLLAKEMIGSI